jgi:hypothetical protein
MCILGSGNVNARNNVEKHARLRDSHNNVKAFLLTAANASAAMCQKMCRPTIIKAAKNDINIIVWLKAPLIRKCKFLYWVSNSKLKNIIFQ